MVDMETVSVSQIQRTLWDIFRLPIDQELSRPERIPKWLSYALGGILVFGVLICLPYIISRTRRVRR